MTRMVIPYFTQGRVGRMARESSKARIMLIFLVAVALTVFGLAPSPVFANVTISSFAVQGQPTQILVTWVTATEYNNAGFNLLRSSSSNGTFTKINASLLPSNCVACIGGSTYSYTDSKVTLGQTQYYKLQTVDLSGATESFGPKSAMAGSASPSATPVPPTATTAPPTATKLAPTSTLFPTNTATPVPSAVPSLTPTRLGAPTATPVPSVVSAAPTHVAKAVPSSPKPNSAGSTNQAPSAATITPETTEVAVLIQRPTQETAADNSDIETNAQPADQLPDQSYYLNRLIRASLILVNLLGIGSAALGVMALFLFVRLRRR
jgi:hypothetical protein